MNCNTLSDHINAWDRINVSTTVRQWIVHGVPLVFYIDNVLPSPFECQNPVFKKSEIHFIRSELDILCSLGAVERCRVPPICVSPLKCIPKKNGSFRLCNKLIPSEPKRCYPKISVCKFRRHLKHYSTRRQTGHIRFKNGFFHVKIEETYRDYLGFKFENKFYRWAVCPFGLNCSPYYFNRVLKPVTHSSVRMELEWFCMWMTAWSWQIRNILWIIEILSSKRWRNYDSVLTMINVSLTRLQG